MPSCCGKTQPDVVARQRICQGCPSWVGRCAKNFNLASFMGCPERRFPPIGNAGYAPDHQLKVGHTNPDCCGKQVLPPPSVTLAASNRANLTAAEVASNFTRSMIRWKKEGFAVVSQTQHEDRYSRGCRNCPHYRNFMCLKCGCIAYLKTKLASETCPDTPPRWK